jgi:hypothetical protein
MSPKDVEETIVALERAALDRWCTGDPYGFVESSDDGVTYFDHVTESRVDGVAALREHMRRFVGEVDVPSHEMPNARVRVHDDVAVLTFNWETYSADGELTSRWNATEVFLRRDGRWRYIHIHWAPIVTGE